MTVWRNGTSAIATTVGGMLAWSVAEGLPTPIAPDWEGPGEPELIVTLRAQQGSTYSPSQVHFYVDIEGSAYDTPAAYDGTPTGFNGYDAQYHRVEAVVHTGETGNYSNTNLLPYDLWKSKAYQYGFVPKHVYSEPGSYAARVYVFDQDGKWGVSPEVTVSVTEPDDFFSNAQTIPVASDNDFTGAPAHDVANRCTTMDQAVARVRSIRSSQSRFRITLKPGDTLLGPIEPGTVVQNWLRGWAAQNGHLLVDTWDFTDNRATVDLNAGSGRDVTVFDPNNNEQPSTIKWRGINWIGTWDSVTATYRDTLAEADWRRYAFFSMPGGTTPAVREYTCADCNFTGWQKTCFGFFGTSPALKAMSDSVRFCLSNVGFHGLGDFAIFGPAGRAGLIACTYTQPDGYANRGSGRNRVGPLQHAYQAHAFLREGATFELYMRSCFVRHSHGWPGVNNGPLRFSVQPGTRINDGSTEPRPDKRVWICDSVFNNSVSANGANPVDNFRVNVVVENVVSNRAALWSGQSNIRGLGAWSTLRNSHGWVPNLSTARTTGNFSGRRTNWWLDGDVGVNIDFLSEGHIDFGNVPNLTGEVQLIHNTLVHLRTNANGPAGAQVYIVPGSAGFTLQETGTLLHAPNLNTPVVPSGGMTRQPLPSGAELPNGHMRMPFDFYHYLLTAEVDIGESTPEIPYGTDYYSDAISASSFTGTLGRHSITLHPGSTASYSAGMFVTSAVNWRNGQAGQKEGTFIDQFAGISVAFNTNGFVITNNSPRAWPTNRMLSIYLDRGTSLMAADFHPDLVIPANTQGIYAPNTATAPTGSRTCLFAIDRSFRPGGTKGNVSGTAFAGAVPVSTVT